MFRGGFQDSHNRAARGEGEAADLGHGGPGALPHHHQHLLPRHARRHRRLRRHQRRELRQRQEMATRDRPELRGGQQDTGREQERRSRQKGGHWLPFICYSQLSLVT